MVDLRTEAPAMGLSERPILDHDDLATLHPAPRPSVDICIVTYDSRLDLERCFASVERAAQGIGARILAAANDSQDGSLEYALTRRSTHVEGIAMGRNSGYACAVNAGAACSQAEYLIVLNPDVQVPGPGTLARLVDHLEEHPEAGAVAPRLLDPDGGVQASARVVPTLGMLAARQTPLGKTAWGRKRAARYLALPAGEGGHANVEWAIGAALVVRRADFDTVGGWDEGFFLYFEDVDFCTRLRGSGRQVHYLPGVELVHAHHRRSDRRHGSVRESSARRSHMKSSLRFFRKHPRYALRPQGAGRSVAAVGRRAFDVAIAAAMLAFLAPLMLLVALAVRLDSNGPVLFRQKRLGKGGREF